MPVPGGFRVSLLVLKRAHAGLAAGGLFELEPVGPAEAQLVVFKLTAKREEFRVTGMPAAHIAQPNRNFGKFPETSRLEATVGGPAVPGRLIDLGRNSTFALLAWIRRIQL